MSLAVQLVTCAADLAALEPEWWDLWRTAPEATPFQSPAWLIPWWEAFEPGELATIVIRDEGRLVALAPLYLENGPLGRRLLPLGIGISDFLDVLLAPEHEDAAAAAASAIRDLPTDWDSVELEELQPGAAAFRLPCPEDRVETVCAQSACPGISITNAVDESGLPFEVPGKRRQSCRRRWREAEGAGGIEIITPEPPDFLRALEELHALRWRARGEVGVLADPCVVAFHRLAMPRLCAAGLASFSVARIGGRLAGAYFQLCWRDRAAAYLGGFDPAFARESPMTILIADALRDGVRDGIRDFSFLRGREDYKYHWGARDRWNMRRSFRRPA